MFEPTSQETRRLYICFTCLVAGLLCEMALWHWHAPWLPWLVRPVEVAIVWLVVRETHEKRRG